MTINLRLLLAIAVVGAGIVVLFKARDSSQIATGVGLVTAGIHLITG
jgi:hypothetical protein